MACPVHHAKEPPPLFVNGSVHFQAHHFGWIVSGGFTLVAVVASLWLIQKHAKWYSCKPQQRHIIRLLLMVPIYSIITLSAYVFYSHATSLLLVRDAYESVVLASFFVLMLQYLPGPVPPAPRSQSGKSLSRSRHPRSSEEEREEILLAQHEHIHMTKAERRAAIHRTFHALRMHSEPRSETPNAKPALKWIWPLGSVRARPRDGLAFLQYMRWGILQYCIVRPGSALAAVILQQFGLYCETSWSIVVAVSISVTVAMYCLIQLYVTIRQELQPYSPLLKLFSVKAVVFLTFWQSALLSGLASLNIIKDTEYMTSLDITVGFGALLQTLEMMIFAFVHIKAFSYQPYKRLALAASSPSALASQQWRNLGHAFDFTDTFRDIYHGILYHLGRGPSKEADDVCRRGAGFKEVFGRERLLPSNPVNTEDARFASFSRIHGYRGVPTQDIDTYTSRAIVHPAPRLSLPSQSPVQGNQMSGVDTLSDPPPVSVLRGVEPLPPGAYIPRLPGSPGPWAMSIIVTPPTTPPLQPIHIPTEQHPREERSNPRVMHAPPPRSTLRVPITQHAQDAHTSRAHPITSNFRLSAIPRSPPPTSPASPTSPQSPDSRRRAPSPALLLSDDMQPPSRADSLLARVFSGPEPRSTRTSHTGALETIPSGEADTSSYTTVTDSIPESTSIASYKTWERATTQRGQFVLLDSEPQEPASSRPASSKSKSQDSTNSFASLLDMPNPPPRPLRRVGPTIVSKHQQLYAGGPSTRPRTMTLPAPLSPARYPPFVQWRTPAPQETRPVPWSLLQSRRSSTESGVAGWAAGRASLDRPVYPACTSSLSSLSNIEDRYPPIGQN